MIFLHACDDAISNESTEMETDEEKKVEMF